MMLLYGSGAVLLLGGTRLYKAALFPIVLLWFSNPIPHIFSLWIDLPLQHASAHIARSFAMHLGHSLTPDHLRLMFTPNFGMFIAPGCNGIRGSITMGFIALIAGYVYRFRWYANALVVIGAVLLGYVFNLARLCLLVLYYVVALHFNSLQDKAENADYLIGAALFLLATLLLFAVIHWLRDSDHPKAPDGAALPDQGEPENAVSRGRYARFGVMGLIALLGCSGLAQAYAASHAADDSAAHISADRFPQHLGSYTLVRSWNEAVLVGPVIYVWAEYAPAGGGTPITVGIAPSLGWHDPLICHYIRGEKPLWQGPLTVKTAGTAQASFDTAFYNDGATQYIEASTICRGGACGEFATERTHLGFVYTGLDPGSLLNPDPKRPLPMVVRAETLDLTVPPDTARQQLTGDLRDFLASIKLEDLTQPFSR
jgi:exosortase J